MKNKGLKKRVIASSLAIATIMGTTLPNFILPSYAGEPDYLIINSGSLANEDDTTSQNKDNEFDGGNNWATSYVRLTINASKNPSSSDSSVGFAEEAYSFDGGTTWQEENFKDYTENVAGPINISIKDSKGNIYNYSCPNGISSVDKELPVVTAYVENSSAWTREKKIVVTATDGISGVARYSFDGGVTWQKDNFKVYYENTEDIKIAVKDVAGNISDPVTVNVEKIDRTAPEILSIEGNPTEYQREKRVELVVNAEDEGSGELKYSFNGGEWTDSNVSPAFDANQTVNVQVKDSLGNTVSRDVVIDKIDDVYALIQQESEVWDDQTNKSTVTVRSSNKELAESDEWKHPKLPGNTIQKDMYALVKVYDENGTYEDVEFTDNHGFSSKLNIVVEKIDDQAPVLDVQQIENEDGTVTVRVESDEDLDLTNTNDEFEYVDPEDKTVIEATYDRNIDLGEVTFSDKWGNETIEAINVTGCRFVVLISEVSSGINGVSLIEANSVLPLKNIKPTWHFENENTMEKLYYKNGTYTTTFTNIYGETYDATFEVTDALFLVAVEEIYNDYENTVTVLAKSTHEFKDTKPTWTLSPNKKTYTKVFDKNGYDYLTTFESIYGETEEVRIQTTYVDDVAPVINITMDELDDGGVKVTATANEKCANTKPTWNLDSTKKIFTKTYYKNGIYTTTFTDKHGNQTEVTFEVTGCSFKVLQSRTTDPNDNNKIIVTAYCATGFNDTKPTWTLSADKKTYTKVFLVSDDPRSFDTVFENSDGERKTVRIILPS